MFIFIISLLNEILFFTKNLNFEIFGTSTVLGHKHCKKTGIWSIIRSYFYTIEHFESHFTSQVIQLVFLKFMT